MKHSCAARAMMRKGLSAEFRLQAMDLNCRVKPPEGGTPNAFSRRLNVISTRSNCRCNPPRPISLLRGSGSAQAALLRRQAQALGGVERERRHGRVDKRPLQGAPGD